MSYQTHTPGVRTYLDGREVCDASAAGKKEYQKRTIEMADRQDCNCAMCQNYMTRSTFDHESGRGGGKRDDRILHADGSWRNAAVCWNCNGEKGSKHYSWKNGKYLPKTVTANP